ncbi:MAG TPA: hypothetical protein VFG75_06170 [Gaiella sp.]|nr:hypothetical protein [Gaiella sp.]
MLDRSIKSIATIAATAVAALVVAGLADAATRPDDRPMRGPGAIALTNDWAVAESAARRDDRPAHEPGAIEAARRDVVLRPDDRADRRLPNNAPLVQPTTDDGFDWVDAGIGSAATLGLILLVAGASLVRLRQGPQAA